MQAGRVQNSCKGFRSRAEGRHQEGKGPQTKEGSRTRGTEPGDTRRARWRAWHKSEVPARRMTGVGVKSRGKRRTAKEFWGSGLSPE